ncbi:MBL fold metallo-hydrolase [Lacticaseibacillus daqingensis]|uniref:MBL fold metallo-hydrolase n=1 Tax=Lacticaseibacillus daqingensis TaxID=2486014 RepID=UPI000F7AEF0A|nr:MBL fold metallo-hydrolase [Lacticaseibacillus daqingensis]
MKIKYLGTAAAERIPAMFCSCSVCTNAREKGGRELRTQTQTLIDDGRLMIDFPGDSYLHQMKYGINFNGIRNLLITHWHSDHLYAEDLAYRMKGYSQGIEQRLEVYVNAYTMKFIERAFELEGRWDTEMFNFHIVRPYESFMIDQYEVFTLPAQHGNFKADCFIYVIREKSGPTILWTHDTGYLTDSMFEFLTQQGFHFDFVSLDCTSQTLPGKISAHMNWRQNLALIEALKEKHLASAKTQFVINHFSHNGGQTYAQMREIAQREGVMVAYDGAEYEITAPQRN